MLAVKETVFGVQNDIGTCHMLLDMCECSRFQLNDLTQICQATLSMLQNRSCLPSCRKRSLQALNNLHRNEAYWKLSRHVEDSFILF